jgi:hypothetical protein
VDDLVTAYRQEHPDWSEAQLRAKAIEMAWAQDDLLSHADWSDRKFERDCWLVEDWRKTGL